MKTGNENPPIDRTGETLAEHDASWPKTRGRIVAGPDPEPVKLEVTPDSFADFIRLELDAVRRDRDELRTANANLTAAVKLLTRELAEARTEVERAERAERAVQSLCLPVGLDDSPQARVDYTVDCLREAVRERDLALEANGQACVRAETLEDVLQAVRKDLRDLEDIVYGAIAEYDELGVGASAWEEMHANLLAVRGRIDTVVEAPLDDRPHDYEPVREKEGEPLKQDIKWEVDEIPAPDGGAVQKTEWTYREEPVKVPQSGAHEHVWRYDAEHGVRCAKCPAVGTHEQIEAQHREEDAAYVRTIERELNADIENRRLDGEDRNAT